MMKHVKQLLLIEIGGVYCTPLAMVYLQKAGVPPLSLIMRHAQGDFGEVSDKAKKNNMHEAYVGGAVLSTYDVAGMQMWVVTRREMVGRRRSNNQWEPILAIKTTLCLHEEFCEYEQTKRHLLVMPEEYQTKHHDSPTMLQ